MHRFFISDWHLWETYRVEHSNPLFHQIGRVFRGKKGDRMIFFKEYSDDVIYEITDIGKQGITLIKREIHKNKQQTENKIILAQAYPNKLATLELLIQKIVEIGITDIVLFGSERSQMNNIPENKKQRLMLIAQEAMEQSGWNVPLSITQESWIKEVFHKYSKQNHLIADPLWTKNYKIENTDVVLWIGPEGGWSEWERLLFREKSCQSWNFSEKILRLETAAIVGAGILLYWVKPL